ncbi:MAG: host-nuclease inhibitor Gam family protein [Smithellaceae bacterium]|jgi:hypothetical protein
MNQAKKNFSDSPAHQADTLLDCIRRQKTKVAKVETRFYKEQEALDKKYASLFYDSHEALSIAEQSLIALMKKERAYLFAGTDILKLGNGSLIHNTADKVSIPKDAVERLKEQKFFEAIRTVEHADRDIIEKWPDAKLLLIGASRKTKEEFGYELKHPVSAR